MAPLDPRPLEELRPGIWVHERPVWFSGARLRARATVLRLEDGGLLLHSPPPPTDDVRAALDALGPVRWIVAPNKFHHLAAPAMKAAYPEARLLGPASVTTRNAAVTLDLPLDDPSLARALPELERLPLDGVPFLDETLLFHRPSGTLLGADVALSACARDHWTWRWSGRLTGCWERLRTPPDVRLFTKRSDAAARAIDRLAALPVERLLVAHADPILDRPIEQLAEAWAFVGAAPRPA